MKSKPRKRLIPSAGPSNSQDTPVERKKPRQKDVVKRQDPSPSSSSSSVSSSDSEESTSSANPAQLDFEFEALPPLEEDLEGIITLLQQIFLRRAASNYSATSTKNEDGDDPLEALAKRIVEQSPLGCVLRPLVEEDDEEEGAETDEGEEEGSDGSVYGVVSIVKIDGQIPPFIRAHLLNKAKKHAPDTGLQRQLEEALTPTDELTGLVINERLLHFPAHIAGPAFKSLISDIESTPSLASLNKVLMVLKVRIADPVEPTQPSTSAASTSQAPSTSSAKAKKGRKKLGKAAKKRLAAQKLAAAEVIFDNPEEALMFEPDAPNTLSYFQYPVQSDVERDSEFHSSTIYGRLYKAHRRVVLMTMEQFKQFAKKVTQIYS